MENERQRNQDSLPELLGTSSNGKRRVLPSNLRRRHRTLVLLGVDSKRRLSLCQWVREGRWVLYRRPLVGRLYHQEYAISNVCIASWLTAAPSQRDTAVVTQELDMNDPATWSSLLKKVTTYLRLLYCLLYYYRTRTRIKTKAKTTPLAIH